jgi:hypothetical protein
MRYDNLYNLNINRLAVLNIPTFMRQPITIGISLAMVKPVDETLTNLKEFRKQQLFYANISPSVCRLEYMLNFVFYRGGINFPRTERIYIEDSERVIPPYIYLSDEEQDLYISVEGEPDYEDVFINTKYETGAIISYDFIVNVPLVITDFSRQESRFRALLDEYKLPNKEYEIRMY